MNILIAEGFSAIITAAYNESKAYMEEIKLDGPTEREESITDTDGFTRNYNYDLSEINDYSNLLIRKLDLTCGLSFMVSNNLSISGEYSYLYYVDEYPYLYDGSGNAHLGRVSVGYKF